MSMRALITGIVKLFVAVTLSGVETAETHITPPDASEAVELITESTASVATRHK